MFNSLHFFYVFDESFILINNINNNNNNNNNNHNHNHNHNNNLLLNARQPMDGFGNDEEFLNTTHHSKLNKILILKTK